jgi:hypothetical protein
MVCVPAYTIRNNKNMTTDEMKKVANEIRNVCKGISGGANATFMIIYAYVESSFNKTAQRPGSEFMGLYQLGNDKGTESQRKDVNYSVKKAWEFFNSNKAIWNTHKKDVAMFNWEDWFGYGMHQQGAGGFRELMLNLDKRVGKVIRNENEEPIMRIENGKRYYQCEGSEMASDNKCTRVYYIEENAGNNKRKFENQNVCEFLNYLKFDKFEEAIKYLKSIGIINDNDLKDVIRNNDRLCSDKYLNILKYSIRKELRPLEKPEPEQPDNRQDKTRVAPKSALLQDKERMKANEENPLAALGIPADQFGNIATPEQAAEISHGPNYKTTNKVNNKNIKIDKQIIPIG